MLIRTPDSRIRRFTKARFNARAGVYDVLRHSTFIGVLEEDEVGRDTPSPVHPLACHRRGASLGMALLFLLRRRLRCPSPLPSRVHTRLPLSPSLRTCSLSHAHALSLSHARARVNDRGWATAPWRRCSPLALRSWQRRPLRRKTFTLTAANAIDIGARLGLCEFREQGRAEVQGAGDPTIDRAGF